MKTFEYSGFTITGRHLNWVLTVHGRHFDFTRKVIAEKIGAAFKKLTGPQIDLIAETL